MSTFITRRRIRFGDCDPAGVVYTPRVGNFVIEAVLDFMADRLAGSAERRLMEMGILPPARALSVEFLKPMTWDDELEIHVSVKEIRTHAFAISIVGCIAGEEAFRSELTQVCVSPETRRPVPIPEALRSALSKDVGG